MWYNQNMKTSEILNACIGMLRDHLERGETIDLFRRMYPHPLTDVNDIAFNIQRIDNHTATALKAKISGALMDSRLTLETQGEALMLRLRLENAIRMLTVLSKAKVLCEVQTTIPEEAVCWALTTLWSGSSDQWVYHTAQAFWQGKPSALPWPLPA